MLENPVCVLQFMQTFFRILAFLAVKIFHVVCTTKRYDKNIFLVLDKATSTIVVVDQSRVGKFNVLVGLSRIFHRIKNCSHSFVVGYYRTSWRTKAIWWADEVKMFSLFGLGTVLYDTRQAIHSSNNNADQQDKCYMLFVQFECYIFRPYMVCRNFVFLDLYIILFHIRQVFHSSNNIGDQQDTRCILSVKFYCYNSQPYTIGKTFAPSSLNTVLSLIYRWLTYRKTIVTHRTNVAFRLSNLNIVFAVITLFTKLSRMPSLILIYSFQAFHG